MLNTVNIKSVWTVIPKGLQFTFKHLDLMIKSINPNEIIQ